MTSSEILSDAFGRLRDTVRRSVSGVSAGDLARRPYPDGNTIAWLIWHLTRLQDNTIAAVESRRQLWVAEGWAAKFALPFELSVTGYGQNSAEVAAVQVESASLLTDYHDAVCEQTLIFLQAIDDDAFDRVVDESWDPPVTLGVRLVSILSDSLQHVGQAAYLKGMFRSR